MNNQEILKYLGDNMRVYELLEQMVHWREECDCEEMIDMLRTKWFEGCEYSIPIFLLANSDSIIKSTRDRLFFIMFGKTINDLGAKEAVEFVKIILCDEYKKWEEEQDKIETASILSKKQRT